ncbi:beta-phosphoglucomutase [Clostridium sp. MCC353]|uniref:beta-phosphoglucomutase n=1 Tax=Clostridium sp. MCC353 TaxID=2592646 RepID=UPI00207A3059|nr:beta-phosphoglucomutase [Clostridium sp. MCC353]
MEQKLLRETGMKQAFIFDLDGVVTDTAIYHYQAWRELGRSLGFEFPEWEGEKLKGISRMASLEIVLEAGKITGLKEGDKRSLADRKNRIYLGYIQNLDSRHILPGITEFLDKIKGEGYKTALGSASRSGDRILKNLGIRDLFDVVVDGCSITRAKPDPEVFLTAAMELGVEPADCIVIEDAAAGVEAAVKGGMHCIGIGKKESLRGADLVLEHTGLLMQADYKSLFDRRQIWGQ